MGTHNTLVANYSRCGTSRARPEDPEDHGPYQYDYGRKLELVGFKDLPQNFEMFFDIGMGKAITRIGTDCVVDIPNVCFERFGELKAWLFLHDSETDGETRYTVKIEIRSRTKTADDEPTPEEQSAITQAIAALNAGVEHVEQIEEEIQDTIDTALQEAKDSGEFDGPPGPKGDRGETGPKGDRGDPGEESVMVATQLLGNQYRLELERT